MKSWLHNISESYIYETPATRRDLKEHYSLLSEEEKFGLLSENALKYLDEQLKVAYGFGIGDLTEEELGKVLQSLFEAGRAGRAKREHAKEFGIPRGARGVAKTQEDKWRLEPYREIPQNELVQSSATNDPSNAAFFALGGKVKADDTKLLDPRGNPEEILDTLSDIALPGRLRNMTDTEREASGQALGQFHTAEVRSLRRLGRQGRAELDPATRAVFAPRAKPPKS